MSDQNHHLAARERTFFGFWVYLMTDLIIFGVLFAAYIVLRGNTFGGPTSKQLFDLPFALTETMILLVSSFTCGLGMLAVNSNKKTLTLVLFGITFLLGIWFLVLELTEFTHLFQEGNNFQRSAFLSSFFTLVGTHGLHITTGLFWMLLILIRILSKGLTEGIKTKLVSFSMFWHFLDIVWIFIFTVVYLMGVI